MSQPLYVDQAARAYPTLFHVDTSVSWANPSSSHKLGLDAKASLQSARLQIAQAIGFPVPDPTLLTKQIIFTSGGTESNNLVLLQPTWKFIVTVATEHHAVLYPSQYMANHTPCEVFYLSVDGQGRLDLDELRQLLAQEHLQNGPGLVSLAYVNNEIGNVLDVAGVGNIIRTANKKRTPGQRVWFHTDGVQAPGHVTINMGVDGALAGVDFLSLSGHKFHGPAGVGILVCRSTSAIRQPLMYGGQQQGGLRPGTEPVGAIVAMANALRDANDTTKLSERMRSLRSFTDAIWMALMPFIVSGVVLPTGCTNPEERACHHVSFCVHGAHRNDLVASMEKDSNVLISGGSACTTDSSLPSHVLDAMRVPLRYIHGSVRITLSYLPQVVFQKQLDLNTATEIRNILIPGLLKLLEKRSVGRD